MKCIWAYIGLLSLTLNIILQGVFRAQEIADGFIYKHWTNQDGLPVNAISGIEFTSNGYIWLSTYDGIVRFDGNRFVTFNKSNTEGIISNRLLSLEGNGGEEVWAVTQPVGGVQYHVHFNGKEFKSYGLEDGIIGEVFHKILLQDGTYRFVDEAGVAEIRNGDVVRKYEEQIQAPIYSSYLNEEIIAVINEEGLHLINESDSVIIYTYEQLGLEKSKIKIVFDSESNTWLSGLDKTVRIDEEGNIIEIEIPDGYSSYNYPRGREDESLPGRMLLPLDNQHTLQYFQGEMEVIQYGESLEPGEYLIAGEGIFEDWTWSLTQVFYKGQAVLSLAPPDRVNQIQEDKNGDLWVGTRNGLLKLEQNRFLSYSREEDGIWNVYPMFEDSDGAIWTASLNSNVYKFKEGRWQNETKVDNPRIFSIAEMNENEIWLGHTRGLKKFQKTNPAKIEDVNYENSIDLRRIRGLLKDSAGNLWIGGDNGIQKLSSEGKWSDFYECEDGSLIKDINFFYESEKGEIWFGNRGNGIGFIRDNQVHFFEGNHLLPDNIIRSLYIDKEGIVWVGTQSAGLARVEIDEQNELVGMTIYNRDSGLFGLVIHSILEDDYDRLWMSSNRGIFWLYKNELNAFARGEISQIHSISFDESDGLPGSEANGGMQSTGIEDRDGNFWFPMVNGVVKVDPDNFGQESIQIPSLIEEFVFADSLTTDLQQELSAPANRRDIQIRYTAFSLQSNPENIQFRYKLGADQDDPWINAGTRREAIFTDMNPGNYIFTVQASMDGVNWEEEGSSLGFEVEPYYYETPIFRISVISVVLLFLYGVHRYRLQNLRRVEKMRLQIAHDLHDEIGSNLGSIVLRSNILSKEEELHEKGKKNLSEIERISVETAQSMRDIIWVINPERGKMNDLVDKLNETSDILLGDIEREFNADLTEGEKAVPLDIRRNLTLVVKEALHNIVKHANASKVSIQIKQHAAKLDIVISDNGIGFDQTKVKEDLLGTGLESMARRARDIKGEFSIFSKPGSETVIQLSVPLT